MAKNGFLFLQCLSFVLFLNMGILWGATDEDRKIYVVYMGSLPGGVYLPSSHHESLLQEVTEGSSVGDMLVRSYKRSFNGFAAKLTNNEREKLARMKGVVSVFPSQNLQLHTTRSWDFIGFNESINRKLGVESDIIVGVIDSGIWPESESFNNEGFGPAPKKWKGACEGGKNFTCNNKLIGARYYTTGESGSARDDNGHGSHTASTVAGKHVQDASFFGLGQGTARGGVPSSRIAAYKVCSPSGCEAAAVLAAFDDAIADGVDLITISIGAEIALDLRQDTIAIGAFHAMTKGILTLNSAGNSGPVLGLTASVAPWMMSVAASTIDRLFVGNVVLGNGKTLVGYSVNTFTLKGKKFPLIYGEGDPEVCSKEAIQKCITGCLNSSFVKGKIAVCEQPTGFPEARNASAAGAIFLNDKFQKVSFVVSLPASGLSPNNYSSIISYINSTKNPRAEILRTSVTKDFDAPVVANFSSRGPNEIISDILKPDISAPGVDILAAYSPLGLTSSLDPGDKRHVKYNILSGTSMACPHVAGVAAYVKSFHPDWSPSAIKSAIMTTAWPMNSSKNTEAEFAYGSGHVNPVKAINPGLVYETFKQDYIKMLCGLGYNESDLRSISGDNSSCPEGSEKASPRDLNYPSISAQVSPAKAFTIKFSRTVTNVGLAKSTYRVNVLKNPRISIQVEPGILSFKSLNENKSFNVTVTGKGLPDGTIASASLVWSDGNRSVRSPVVVLSTSERI